MDEGDRPDPLKDLGARIDKAAAGRQTARKSGADRQNGLAFGFRVGLELVVAVGVGVGLGLLADRWLGARPWGMLGGFFLGVAAGMVNVYRAAAGLGMGVGYKNSGGLPPTDQSDEE